MLQTTALARVPSSSSKADPFIELLHEHLEAWDEWGRLLDLSCVAQEAAFADPEWPGTFEEFSKKRRAEFPRGDEGTALIWNKHRALKRKINCRHGVPQAERAEHLAHNRNSASERRIMETPCNGSMIGVYAKLLMTASEFLGPRCAGPMKGLKPQDRAIWDAAKAMSETLGLPFYTKR